MATISNKGITNSGAGFIVYRGYTISTSLAGVVGVTKDGVTILHDAGSVGYAKITVDALFPMPYGC